MRPRLAFALLVALAAALQLGLALRHPLWADEIFSLAMATGHSLEHPAAVARTDAGDFVEPTRAVDAAELRRYVQFEERTAGLGPVVRAVFLSDSSPPLYYVLLHGWCRVWGVGDLALRSFSIVVALACLPLQFMLGRRIGGVRTAWAATALLAIAPLAVYYGSEGRMYSLLWFFTLAIAWAALQIHDGRRRGRGWLVWMVASAGGLLTHYYFVFPWFVTGAFLLWCRPAERGRVVGCGLVVALVILPWYWHVPENLRLWRVTADWVKLRPEGYNRVRVLREVLVQYFAGEGHYLWRPQRAAELGAASLFAAALATALWRQGRSACSADRVLIALWFGAACLGPLAVDLLRGSYIAEYPRYTSTALPAACLLGAWAFAELEARLAWGGLTLVALCWMAGIVAMFRSRSRCDQPYHDLARHVAAYGSAGDLVVVHSIPSGAIALARYSTTRGQFLPWVEQLGNRQLPDALETVLPGRVRVLVVKIHTVGAPAPEEAWLRKYARFVREQRIGAGRIEEFRPLTGEAF
jgi:4-amino-4-deoxy-L-arabinose transferase-like glycosyltransferase